MSKIATPEKLPPAGLVWHLAAFFRARPNQWVDGERLEKVAGKYAWRTRVSDLRRPPFSMTIENRQRRIRWGSRDGSFKVSEYRYIPPPLTGA